MLLAAAVQHQCKVIDLGIARDDESELEKILENAFSAGANILLTSGGVSMGDRDYVKPLLSKKGIVYFNAVCRWLLKCFYSVVPFFVVLVMELKMSFQVFMRPGKPVTFAEIKPDKTEKKELNQILAFGLPGNPVSSLVCFQLFVVPAIRQLGGWENPHLLRYLKNRTVVLSLSLSFFLIIPFPISLIFYTRLPVFLYKMQSASTSFRANKVRSYSTTVSLCNCQVER